MKPILTLSAASAAEMPVARITAARTCRMLASPAYDRRAGAIGAATLDPGLQHVVVRPLAVHHVDALQRDPPAVLPPPQTVKIRAGEMPRGVAPELHHVETRPHHDHAVGIVFDHHVRHEMVRAPLRLL